MSDFPLLGPGRSLGTCPIWDLIAIPTQGVRRNVGSLLSPTRGCFYPNFGKISYHCPRPPPSLKGKAWNIFPLCGFMKKLCIKMSWLRQKNIWLWHDSWFWCQIWHFGILLNFTIVCQTFTSKTTSLKHVFDKVSSAKWPHKLGENIMFLSKSGLYIVFYNQNLDF